MMNKKVLNFRTHIGVVKGTKTSLDATVNEAEMELTPVGVFIRSIKGVKQDILVPLNNVLEIQLAHDEEEKRGPGRPAGAKLA